MKFAIYSRKSKFTGKGESIENQIDLCRQYLQSQYGDLPESDLLIYEDEGFSGGNTDRPQFREMMSDARKRKFSALICYRLDRISRNTGDFAKLIEELKSLSISFISIREHFDTESPMGRAMMYIASVFSQLERETTAERIRDNMQELAKTGRWLGGTTPTGYRSRPAERKTADGKIHRFYQLAVQPDEMETVKLIFQKFIETNSLTKVETFLIQNNILSKRGKHYSRFTIKFILKNPVYLIADQDAYRYFADSGAILCGGKRTFDGRHGIMAYNKTLQQHGKTIREQDKANWIVAVGKHPGILPGRDWIRVQEMLNQNKSKSYRKPKSNAALLSGLLRCGNCGSYMRPKLTKRKNAEGELIYTYLCELKEKSRGQNCSIQNANGNLLDKAVCGEVKKLSDDPSFFIRRLRACRQSLKGNGMKAGAELSRLTRAVGENEKAIANLTAALETAQGTAATGYITNRINELDEKNIRLKTRINELNRPEPTQLLPGEPIPLIKNIFGSFSSAFDTMTAEEKRTALRAFIDKIVWDGENINIYLFGSSAKTASVPQCENSK